MPQQFVLIGYDLIATMLRNMYIVIIQGGPKSKPLPNGQKIVLNRVNEIRLIRQI